MSAIAAEPTALQRAARRVGAGPLLDRLGIEPADWWEKSTQSAPPPNPSETQIGSMYMPAQTPQEPPGEIAAHSRYEIPLGPGFPEMPVWPQETWSLRSFEVQLSGTLVTEDPLSFPKGTETLDVILGLKQRGGLVWSSSLALPLLPVPLSEGREFTFGAGVFVDLVNGLPYRADSQLQFVVSGLAPAFALSPEPLDRYQTESLEQLRASVAELQAGGAELQEGVELSTQTVERLQNLLESSEELANGSSQEIELLESILTALGG